MRQFRSAALIYCLVGVAALAAGALQADVIVTTEGSVIETSGPWEVRGKMVVFKLQSGQVSSMRAVDVDFEATDRWREALAEEQEQAQEPEAEAETREARIVITDKDISHSEAQDAAFAAAERSEEAVEDGEAADGEADGSPDLGTSGVRVTAWDEEEPLDGNGRRVFGTLRNDGNSFATDVSVQVTVYGDDGGIIGTQTATPVRSSLRPGESTTFSVQFADAFSIGAARMTVDSLDLEYGAAESEDPDEFVDDSEG